MRKYILCTAISLTLLLSSAPLNGQGLQEIKISDPLIEELHYILTFVGQDAVSPQQFQLQRIEKILDFVSSPVKSDAYYNAGEFNSATSAYHGFDIHRSMSDILRIAYSPDIHPVVTAPSSIRTSRWIRIDTPDGKIPLLWERLGDSHEPLAITGVEHIINSPDTHSGAYYAYDLDRTLILTRYQGDNLLISLSRQRGTSDVGKKGLIVGDDHQWDYIYTDEPGLTIPGLGWVRSYMYDSYSVIIYRELSTKPHRVRFASFKWIRAGWGDINLVRSHHIYNGQLRFSVWFKRIMESPQVANASHLEQNFATIRGLSDEALRERVREHLNRLENRCTSEGLLTKQQTEELFQEDRYLKSFDRDEMEALVTLEHVKRMLDKHQQTKITYLPVKSNPVD